LAAALLVAAALRARRAPVWAGVLAAMVTLKPHVGLLLPIAWAGQRHWRAFVVAGICTLLLAAVSTLVLGGDTWVAFVYGGSGSGKALLQAMPTAYPLNAASVFWMLRSVGVSIPTAYGGQGVAAVAAAILLWASRRRAAGNDRATAALTACLTLFVSPYLYASDLVGYSVAVALLIAVRPQRLRLLLLLWIAPGLSEIVCALGGRPMLPAFVAAATLLAWRWAAADASAATVSAASACAAAGVRGISLQDSIGTANCCRRRSADRRLPRLHD